MKQLFTIFISACIITACASKSKELTEENIQDQNEALATSVIQPISGLESVKENFVVDGLRSDTILLKNGGSIIFQDNSFVDEEGNQIAGEVDIEWEEFHTLGDIIASGIPMAYDSAGVEYNLVSGGMFTINASQNDKPVHIAPDKKATVNLVSLQDTPCYNFYKLDEESGDWDYKSTEVGEVVEEIKPEENTASNIIDADVDIRRFPELEKLDIVGWKVNEPLSKSDKAWLTANKSLSRLIQLKPEKYTLEVKSADGARRFEVQPYLMEEAVVDSQKNARQLAEEVSAIKKYQSDLASGKVVRSIDIAGFGTYNWDIINKRENSLPLLAKFEFPDKTNTALVNLFLVSPDENAVVRYNAAGDDMFSFDPELSNCLIAILPDNEIAYVSNTGFDRARNTQAGKPFTFRFEKSDIKLKSANDIMNHINALI